jgi:zinc resistance-associated protein
MKKAVTIVGALLLVAAIAFPVYARSQGKGKAHHRMGYGKGSACYCWQQGKVYDNLTEEQRGQLQELYKSFNDEKAQLRGEIRSKSAELNILLNSTKPDAEKARTIQKEINDLRAKLAQRRVNFKLEVRKIAPDFQFGKRYSKGYGGNMKGSRPGKCWN